MNFPRVTLYQILSWLSITIAALVLALLLGVWEQSNLALERLLDTVGQNTWVVRSNYKANSNPSFLPKGGVALEQIRAWEGVKRLAVASSLTKPMGQVMSYTSSAVSGDWYAIKRIKLKQGRLPKNNQEVVVGANLASKFGQQLAFGGIGIGTDYTVVGVLEPIGLSRGTDTSDLDYDNSLLRAMEFDTGFLSLPENLFVETTPAVFESTQAKLEQWLKAQGLEQQFVIERLADQYGLALREKTARLLGGALLFGVLAVFAAAFSNLMGFFLARALERIRAVGIRRSLGASKQAVLLEELQQALPLVGLGLLCGVPLAFAIAPSIEGFLGLSVRPGWSALLGLGVGLLLLVGLSAYAPAVWAVRQPPLKAIRGSVGHLPVWRIWLSGTGIVLGVAGLVLQTTTARSAVLETERLIGRFSERVGVYSSGLSSVNRSAFTDPRGQMSIQKKMYRALLRQDFAQNFSRTGFSAALPEVRHGKSGDVGFALRVYKDKFPELAGMKLIKGQLPKNGEEAAIGTELQLEFGWQIGQTFEAQGRKWQVSGIFQAGAKQTLGNLSSHTILVDEEFFAIRGFGNILLEVKESVDIASVLQKATDFLNREYGSPELRPLAVYRPIDLAPDIRRTLDQLTGVYAAMSWALLILGGGGLIAQLLAAVRQRNKEIGVQRAIGARKKDVFDLFFLEGLQLGFVASVLGSLLGLFLAWLESERQKIIFQPDPVGILLALVISAGLAILCSSIPAFLAAQIPPAQAMRQEA